MTYNKENKLISVSRPRNDTEARTRTLVDEDKTC